MLTFHIRSGLLGFDDGTVLQTGAWSGHGAGRNNPDMQGAHGVGPLPVGEYTIGSLIHNGGHLGPDIMRLDMIPGTGESHGRGDFYLHGAAINNPAMSSDGCVIAQHNTRLTVNGMRDRRIRVVAD